MRLYNSMSRSVEYFVPQDKTNVTMYACGPTVYDTPHLGNARPAVVFDTLFRLLRHAYGDSAVEYARNITDIDDKIMDRARTNGVSIADLTERTTEDYHAIVTQLGCLPPTHEPRATANIAAIIGQIAMLILNGHAYESEGHVLFDVASYPAHGILSGHDQSNLGDNHSRIEPASYKRNPADFVLWKPSTWDQPGWDASFGRGRPGWHIECSAMIENIFSDRTIDIHAGGGDLRFPHHDCEISQYACSHHMPDRRLANYWLHNGMLLIQQEKMAKSAGNFFTVQSLIDAGWRGAEIRLALLSTHYRSPLDWKGDITLQAARNTLASWRDALLPYKDVYVRSKAIDSEHIDGFEAALNDDLNIPMMITELHRLTSDLNALGIDSSRATALRYGLDLLGLSDHYDRTLRADASLAAIEIIQKRREAREHGNYSLSDALRDDLKTHGIHVKDTKRATHWWYE